MNCKICKEPINMFVFGAPDDICYRCSQDKEQIVQTNVEMADDFTVDMFLEELEHINQQLDQPEINILYISSSDRKFRKIPKHIKYNKNMRLRKKYEGTFKRALIYLLFVALVVLTLLIL